MNNVQIMLIILNSVNIEEYSVLRINAHYCFKGIPVRLTRNSLRIEDGVIGSRESSTYRYVSKRPPSTTVSEIDKLKTTMVSRKYE
jgi:hypothetical protein